MKTVAKKASTRKSAKLKRSDLTPIKGAVRQFNFERVGACATNCNTIFSAKVRVGL